MAARRRSFLFGPLTILLCAVLGGLFGPPPEVAAAALQEDDISNTLKTFTKVYEALEGNFADQVSPDRSIYSGAIPGMLRTLDPHSSFFDPRTFKLMREDQRGHYYGVGMFVGPRQQQHAGPKDNRTVVMEPFVGSPANKAGIRRGDTILEVNDKKTDGLTTTEVADMLKGERGTAVQVKIGREGMRDPLVLNLTRDEIYRPSVGESFWLKPGVAFLDVNSFNENTSHEMEEQLNKLGESNIKGLVLDLRGNGGGLLNEGVEVAGHFLARGQVVVRHRSRNAPERPYQARRGGQAKDYPIVVLVDRSSASASEIVAGALQDHDRAWILGENTFGKGLVQTVYPLAENTGLALTTAHYYTPSGRLIQRDYNSISFVEYVTHKNLEKKNLNDVKMTDSGRTVYGGGGISPDEKIEPVKLNKFQVEVLLRRNAFMYYATKLFAARSFDYKLPEGWAPDNNVMNDFHQFCLKNGVEFTEAEWAENADWLKQQVREEAYFVAFGRIASERIRNEATPVVQKAVEAMPKAKQLLDQAKKNVVQRLNREYERP